MRLDWTCHILAKDSIGLEIDCNNSDSNWAQWCQKLYSTCFQFYDLCPSLTATMWNGHEVILIRVSSCLTQWGIEIATYIALL